MDVNKSDLDLSGKLIIKVQLGDDIRRIPIHNEAITYDELVLMMQRVFRGKLTPNDDITLKYKDDDGDLITIFDSSDLSFAIQCSRILKLQILLASTNKTEANATLSNAEIGKLKNQLRSIRDQVNTLLDALDGDVVSGEGTKEQAIVSQEKVKTSKINPSEFDPLQEEKTVSKNGTEESNNKNENGKANSQAAQQQQQQQQHQQQQQQQPPQQQMESSVSNNSRPQSANNHASDYFNRTPTGTPATATAGYPTMQYGSLPYPSQFSYPASYVMDSSQIPSSTAHPAYPTQQQAQQQYSHALYQGGPQGNPYSKSYTQPSPQHGFLPPRQ